MRIRYPFAGGFAFLLLASAYLGLTPHSSANPNLANGGDKLLHFFDFFTLTLVFYWIFDTTRRRILQYTIGGVTIALGVGSEIVQALIPNGRVFDGVDIIANIFGSGVAIGLCMWYHKRMIERRRASRYGNQEDVELGNTTHIRERNQEDHPAEEHEREGLMGPQETGVVGASGPLSLEEEIDNWDENATDDDDWDVDDEDGHRNLGNVGEPGPTQKSRSGSDSHSERSVVQKKLRSD